MGDPAAGRDRRGGERDGAGSDGESGVLGVANPVVTAADLDVSVSYEGFESVGSGMGSAGFIVYDDTACMVDAAYRFSRFLSIESCGQCPPCKIGSGEITKLLDKVRSGEGTDHDLAAMGDGWPGSPTATGASWRWRSSGW